MVLATFPVIAGVPHSLEYFNIVFFAVLLSTLAQGATFEPFARALGVTTSTLAMEHSPPPRRSAGSIAQISTARPWSAEDGDPGYPRQVAGIAVAGQLLTRIDRPGALVLLDDGRYAFTGPILAIGSARAIRHAARRRLARSTSEAESAWWREIIGALAR